MIDFITRIVIAGGIMGLLDAFWLSVVANKFYKSQIGSLLLEKPNMSAAILFYIIYVIGIVVFAIMPALEKGSWGVAAGLGALFGLIAYATYDLTNLATLKGWSMRVVVVDMAWGAVLTSLVAATSFWILRTWLNQ
ncbi:DUF2177 family protein [Candidatus Saccharibacteria bacterium]|nr:DUF2177 family protein [Candidatus Saccharibacteria bacterium]